MEELKKKIIHWIKSMKVEGDECYKMCKHAFYENLLDSTSLAYDLFNMLELEIDKETAQNRKDILDSYQLGDEGFFYEYDAPKFFENSKIDRIFEMHANYLTFQAIGAYRAIKALPEKRVSFYDEYMKDIDRYLTYNCPWEQSPWGAGGMVDNLGTIIRCNREIDVDNSEKYESVFKEIVDWLNRHQDEKTGLWMGRENQQGINGLVNGGYHLMRGTYFLWNVPFYMPEKIIDTIIEDIRTNKIFAERNAHGCNDLDHFFLLQKCHECVPEYRKDEIVDIAWCRKKNILETVKREDGAFSFHADSTIENHNYLNVAPGYKESDMLGTVFYLQTLISIDKILDNEIIFRDSLTHG